METSIYSPHPWPHTFHVESEQFPCWPRKHKGERPVYHFSLTAEAKACVVQLGTEVEMKSCQVQLFNCDPF